MIYFARGHFFGKRLHTFELKLRKVVTEPHIPLQNVWQDPLLNASLLPIDQKKAKAFRFMKFFTALDIPRTRFT